MENKPTQPDLSVWQGREDPEDGAAGLRFHQAVKPPTDASGLSSTVDLIGFACEEGVRRNKGRLGAKQAPQRIRQALSNMAWHHSCVLRDLGDIACDSSSDATRDPLADAQTLLANSVAQSLNTGHFPIILGGGHEVAWGSYQGLASHLKAQHLQQPQLKAKHPKQQSTRKDSPPRIGIINFDAHFDLRPLVEGKGSSGTPFNQIAQYCEAQGWPFHYACIGVSRTSNTQTLFKRAEALNVTIIEDVDCANEQRLLQQILQFAAGCDALYLTVDLDVFPASQAPGVSAPAVLGVDYRIVESLIRTIAALRDAQGQRLLRLADIAEYNPTVDQDNQTARLAARLIWQLCATFNNNETSPS
ncbi:formimidoylglutamase [Thaumasiovibrio subtropicus]|uniref:formimidoylglutamase n=1 Tax=Thaumasiovibrio subtropicus TaxID=1891207 RepID=UPI000B35E632|nr:formimidoylglutamase [Thaumasiovibrio subtropicus]